uniref:Uncharacterized protein n=1 Tax=Arundo donax TaxID=35708 RepID=A0A0A8Z160_ARUDO
MHAARFSGSEGLRAAAACGSHRRSLWRTFLVDPGSRASKEEGELLLRCAHGRRQRRRARLPVSEEHQRGQG